MRGLHVNAAQHSIGFACEVGAEGTQMLHAGNERIPRVLAAAVADGHLKERVGVLASNRPTVLAPRWVTLNRDVHRSGRLPFLVALPELAGLAAEDVAERVQCCKVDALRVAVRLHEPMRAGHGQSAPRETLQSVGGSESVGLHKVGQAKSHIQHSTNVTPLVARFNSALPLANSSHANRFRAMVEQ